MPKDEQLSLPINVNVGNINLFADVDRMAQLEAAHKGFIAKSLELTERQMEHEHVMDIAKHEEVIEGNKAARSADFKTANAFTLATYAIAALPYFCVIMAFTGGLCGLDAKVCLGILALSGLPVLGKIVDGYLEKRK